MTVSAKKAREWIYFEAFRRRCNDVPVGIACFREQPDIILRDNDGTFVGIEVTQYFRPTRSGQGPQQEQESLRTRVLDLAKRAFESAHGAYLQVQVLFASRSALNKREVGAIAEALIHFVASIDLADGEQRCLGQDSANRPPAPIATVYLRRMDAAPRTHWTVAEAGFVPTVGPDHVQAMLDRKERSTTKYPGYLSSKWLLIVVDAHRPSSNADLAAAAKTWTYSTSFDRIFYFDYFRGEWFKLGTPSNSGSPT